MILIIATAGNSTEDQRNNAAKLHLWYRQSGWKPRNSTLQVDETTGYVSMVFDHCAHGVAYDPWTTVQLDVDPNGLWRSWNKRDGWSTWTAL